ncbi:MAG TPA: SDR family oxidoreductase [Polyangia bacterium]|nr:SDR family oxidoreductase [Polyangia bacterium]
MGEDKRRVALVTGASSGIGAAIAAELVRRGLRVFGTSRKAVEMGEGVEPVALDVGDQASVDACVADVGARAGHIDVLVNNAGYLLAGAVEEATPDEARALFDTNYFGVVRMTRAVLPQMRARRAGTIVTISSLAGRVPAPFWGHYNASKFAVEGLMETLRHEVAPFGVRVCLVEPGAIKTPFYAQPHAREMAEYDVRRGAALGVMRGFERRAPGPAVVGAAVGRLVAKRNPPLRTLLTPEARIFTFLRWLLPSRLNERVTRFGFQI